MDILTLVLSFVSKKRLDSKCRSIDFYSMDNQNSSNKLYIYKY
jgi:hypothetical protein